MTAQDAIRDGLVRGREWMGGCVVVSEETSETSGGWTFRAIPGAYLTDCSYTGSKEIVYDLTNIWDTTDIDMNDLDSAVEWIMESA